MKNLVVPLLCAVMAGCASTSANMRVGDDMSYVSLKDQRDAMSTVKVLDKLPEGAVSLGLVRASRCYRNTLQAAPSEDDVLADLKIAAYAKGADFLTAVRTYKESGLLQNCWSILNAEATAAKAGQ